VPPIFETVDDGEEFLVVNVVVIDLTNEGSSSDDEEL